MVDYIRSTQEVLEELLANMPDTYSKQKGYWLWDIMKAVAITIAEFSEDLQNAVEKLDVTKLQGDELEDYVNNWSPIEKKKFTRATGYVTFKAKEGKTGTIPDGTYVTSGKCNYITSEAGEITEPGGSVTLPVAAETYGTVGNAEVGEVNKPVTSIEFVEKIVNSEPITGGVDEESDEELLERFLEFRKKKAHSGNQDHYIQWAEEVDGVDGALCVPCPNGQPNEVDLYVYADGKGVAEDVLERVQDYIDPNKNGDGAGEAPVGARVYVKNPTEITFEIVCTLVYEDGYTLEDCKQGIIDSLNDYLLVAFKEQLLRYNRVGKAILSAEGVKDFKTLTVNGKEENITTTGLSSFIINKITADGTVILGV